MITEKMVTIFENIYSTKPNYKPVGYVLDRIKNGRSRAKVDQIRSTLDKDRAEMLKRQLPSVCFSGKFGETRTDESLIKHSGLMVLDFDSLDDLRGKQTEMTNHDFVYACWVSPRGNGLKVLVKIADGAKHRDHFEALREMFPDVDKSGVNPSRVCYESYDSEIYINESAKAFTKIKTIQKVEVKETLSEDYEIFKRLLTWLSNRNDSFVTGERNFFIFKLASACCRFGLSQSVAERFIQSEFIKSGSDFSVKECDRTINSAYKRNASVKGSASFEKEVLVDKVTRKEVSIEVDLSDESIRLKDVVYGEDVKGEALKIYKNGYPYVQPLGIPEFDPFYKFRKTEITLLTGHGNYGKTAFKKWLQVVRAVKFSEKFASFPPEDYPIHSFYHDLVEILLGCDCSAGNSSKPNIDVYNNAYDFISKHFFYVYPKELSPTPEYIKERFLELIVKEKIDGCDIDPFNQMTNDYGKSGGRSDKYLETVLSDFLRFAQINNVYLWIIAHPTKMVKEKNGNYPCPDVYDIADGAMWNNKMNNILVYHRPFMQTAPDDPTCEFHSKKIKFQKVVGKRGLVMFEYIRKTRRYEFNGIDYLARFVKERKLDFIPVQAEVFESEPVVSGWQPYKENWND